MRLPVFRPATFALTALLALSACDTPVPEPEPAPAPAPAPVPEPDPEAPPARTQAEIREARAAAARAANRSAADATESAASRNMRLYLATAEAGMISRGLLQADREPADLPFNADTLARNFSLIALRDEYLADGSRAPDGGVAASLRRWENPVRMQIEFGPSASTAAQIRFRSEVGSYAARLARASGHSVGMTASGGNFIVLYLNEDERRAIGPRLAELIPGIPERDVTALRNLAAQNYCTAFSYSRGGGAAYVNAVALIRAELPPRLRASCIEEELAQGMGLANDHPEVRPSIFNDDERFARLTRHDELLLRILYDPRLRPGMTETEAAPIVRTIAAELTSGS